MYVLRVFQVLTNEIPFFIFSNDKRTTGVCAVSLF